MPKLPTVTNPKLKRRVLNAYKRRNQARRGYATNSAAWRKIRRYVLLIEPLCRACMAEGRVRAANEVDHIDGDSRNNLMDNLQPLCKRCHSRKTARETGFGSRAGSDSARGGAGKSSIKLTA